MRFGKDCIKYINSTVWATLRSSPIHNVGVFAIRDIPKGTKITDNDSYTSKHVLNTLTPDELNDIVPEIRLLLLDRVVYDKNNITEFTFHSPNSDANLQSWMNHSYKPNTTGTHTLRNIKKGEELTENYHTLVEGIHPVSLKQFHFLHRRTRKNTRSK
jgi:SET domain-containing protein